MKINKKSQVGLTRNQQTFNRLTKQIENLEKETKNEEEIQPDFDSFFK